MKIFIVGSLNMDLVIGAPFMPPAGMTIDGSGFMTNAGGKGANQAVAAAKLGGQTYMVGCVGQSFGGELLASLKSCGVHTEYVEQKEGVSSGIAVILVIDGDNRIILDKGANAQTDEALIDRALEEAEEGDYLVAQLEIPKSVVVYALKKAKKKGMITVLNPAPASELTSEFFAYSDYFTPNQTEAEFYTGIYPDCGERIRACAEKLSGLGVRNVLITLGKQGSVYVGEQGYIEVPAFTVKAVDMTAAGDTYVGAFVTRLSEGASVEESMLFASAASSVTVTRRGAQQSIPVRAEVEAKLR